MTQLMFYIDKIYNLFSFVYLLGEEERLYVEHYDYNKAYQDGWFPCKW